MRSKKIEARSKKCQNKMAFVFRIAVYFSLLASRLSLVSAENNFFLIHNFDSQDYSNRLGGITGKWEFDPSDASQWCSLSFSPDNAVFMDQGYSLRIDYCIASAKENYVSEGLGLSRQEIGFHAKSFNGIFTLLNEFDASAYRYLTFWAKGDSTEGFTRRLKIELKDKHRSASAIVEDITDRWQAFYVPLSKFGDVIQLSELAEFVIVFDDHVTRPKGVIYLDQVGFAKEKEKKKTPGGMESLKTPRLNILKVKDPVKIDGKLDEWSGECFDLGKKDLELGQFRGNSDGSAKICLGWDSQYLYLGAKVKDNQVVCQKSGGDIYKMDGLEVFVDPQNDGLEWKNPKDIQLGFAPTGPHGEPQVWSYFQGRKPSEREVKFAAQISKKGYVLEEAISFEFLGINPLGGETFGFSAALHDVDTQPAHECKLNWRFIRDPMDPNRFQLGVVKLIDR